MRRVLTNTNLSYIVMIIVCMFVATANAEVIIIANKNMSINSITVRQAKNLWLGKTKKLPGVGRVMVVDSKKNTLAYKEFYKNIVKKKPRQLKAYWAKITFTGKGFPPKSLDDDQAILEWVAENPKGIGYINSPSINKTVKVLYKN